MKQIYKSDYLTIHDFDNILIQEWSSKTISVDHFKKELSAFLCHFKKIKPAGVLWLQENFSLSIPVDLHQWIEKNILEPQYKCGLRKLAFTIPADQNAHRSMIDSFNGVSSVMHPRYFISKEKALNFLTESATRPESKEVYYEISRSLDMTQITLQVDHRHLPHAIRHLDRLKSQFHFRMKNTDDFAQLTLRELEIFKAICSGAVNRVIADQLFLSESTVATHRKSIVKKLGIKTSKDWHQFGQAFL
ncbi:LuxR C-terminal-related transcriptional regulator [Nonlabens antarcticus]|uniref:LuxR C-terminal-related transcriptional regulator n=1 Tax=Nonlabens antarcticus TaxID=392714 RepID=UPI001890E453|nr:LuxR C-terminal-related transcriptional regulator [Nonlabens antarcticus]